MNWKNNGKYIIAACTTAICTGLIAYNEQKIRKLDQIDFDTVSQYPVTIPTKGNYNKFPFDYMMTYLKTRPKDEVNYMLSCLFHKVQISQVSTEMIRKLLKDCVYIWGTIPTSTFADSWIEEAVNVIRCKFPLVNEVTDVKNLLDVEVKEGILSHLPWVLQKIIYTSESIIMSGLLERGWIKSFVNGISVWTLPCKSASTKHAILVFMGINGGLKCINDMYECIPVHMRSKYPVIGVAYPCSSSIRHKEERVMNHKEFVDIVYDHLKTQEIKSVDVIAWSYGAFLFTNFVTEHDSKLTIRKRLLIEPFGLVHSTTHVWSMVVDKHSSETIKEMNNDVGWVHTPTNVFIIHTFKWMRVGRVLKMHLPFRNIEWGQTWNHKDTLIILSQNDQLIDVEYTRNFIKDIVPLAKMKIGKGCHNQWMKDKTNLPVCLEFMSE